MKVKIFAAFLFFFFCICSAQAQQEVTLEQVISMALESNYDVLLAKNTSEAAHTDNKYVWASFLPQLNASGTQAWNNTDQTLRFEDPARNNSGKAESNNLSSTIQLSWTLFDGTKMFATAKRINAIAAQGDLIVKDQMVNTIAQIITGYYDVVRQKQQLKAILEQMAVSEERVKLADRKLQVGTGAKPELLQARVDYNSLRTQIIQQEAMIVQLKELLNAAVGSKLPPSFEVADSILIDMNIEPNEISQNIEQTNFSLRALRMNMEIALLAKRERQGELFPIVSFNAAENYSRTNNTRLINPFGSLFSQSQGLNYGFTITVPIFNNLNTRRLVKQAEINYQRQELFFGQEKVSLNAMLKNAYINYDNAKKVLVVQEETILLAKENVMIALESFKRNATTAIELRTAQQSLADAYNSLISARYNAKLAETELLRIGGTLIR